MLILARGGRFDWVILPPVHLDWTIGNPLLQRVVKSAFRRFAGIPIGATILNRLLFAGRCKYAVCDASDLHSIGKEFLSISGALACFKRNLIHGLAAESMPHVKWHPLPMQLPDQWLDSVASVEITKETALFSAGDYNSTTRVELREIAKGMLASGTQVDLLTERVPIEEFWKRIAGAWLCAAAEGCGYHSWRMYEAAALSTVPVVNAPPTGMWSWFEDEKNCLFMEPTVEDTARKLQTALEDPEAIRRISMEARVCINRFHRASAAASSLTASLLEFGQDSRDM